MPAPKDPEKIKLWKERMSKARVGKKRSPEFCEQMRQLNLGRVRSEEEKQKNRDAHLGKKMPPRSEEHCQHISDGLKGKPKSEEHKQKLSNIAKNRSESHRNRISIAAKERLKDPDFYKRHCESRRFRYPSYETRSKMVEAHIGGFTIQNIRYYEDTKYCDLWNPNLRNRVRAYWRSIIGDTCFLCGIERDDREFSVHHVHYDKQTCCNGTPHDMVPLCARCSSKVNFKREDWEKAIVEKLYQLSPDGKCFFTREEMATILSTT